jgi:hypothetical protein
LGVGGGGGGSEGPVGLGACNPRWRAAQTPGPCWAFMDRWRATIGRANPGRQVPGTVGSAPAEYSLRLGGVGGRWHLRARNFRFPPAQTLGASPPWSPSFGPTMRGGKARRPRAKPGTAGHDDASNTWAPVGGWGAAAPVPGCGDLSEVVGPTGGVGGRRTEGCWACWQRAVQLEPFSTLTLVFIGLI